MKCVLRHYSFFDVEYILVNYAYDLSKHTESPKDSLLLLLLLPLPSAREQVCRVSLHTRKRITRTP
jgi:hypothetical protein